MNERISICKIVSGGQTGVDQAALDAAMWLGIPHGGWCPRGRRCEAGIIPPQYALRETESRDYAVRTEQNVVDSDGTLIFYRRELTGGTAFTRRMAAKHAQPIHLVDLAGNVELDGIAEWMANEQIRELNVAGPRESTSSGIGAQSRLLLIELLRDAIILP